MVDWVFLIQNALHRKYATCISFVRMMRSPANNPVCINPEKHSNKCIQFVVGDVSICEVKSNLKYTENKYIYLLYFSI